jgi:hypothetical protein
MRSATALTETQVIDVLKRLNAGEYQHVIAASYGVSVKTISRIKRGETWNDVTQRSMVHYSGAKIPTITIIPAKTLDLLDEVIAIKNHFGFSFDQPIHWGWFDGWDGLHSIASDGIIMWESADLVAYAQKLAQSGINDSPIWARCAEELPTFDIEDVMTQSVGKIYEPTIETEEAVQLIAYPHSVFLHSKFVNIARMMKLDIRVANKTNEYVYLTKQKQKADVIIACVATLGGKSNGKYKS